MKLTAFEEEELMKKWQEILGPSNEVVVSFFLKGNSFFSCIKLYLPELGSCGNSIGKKLKTGISKGSMT